ncbi:hypothetical protein BGZ73_002199 [Actinomortierella ambigua]|nr:hypothetical protein BGZ73_002199 [Actinomortierella ambigua]
MFTVARSAASRASAARSWSHVRFPKTRSSLSSFRVSLGYTPVAPWSALFSTATLRFTQGSTPKQGSESVYTSPPPNSHTDSTAATDQASQQDGTPLLTSDKIADTVSCTVSPPATEAFLKPTPVVLLTGPFGGNWCFRDTWQAVLADQGYQSTSIELAMPPKPLDSGDAYVRHFVRLLKTSIETDHSFFPPILIAHGFHALVAEKYIESNPVSALILVSPFIPSVIKGRFLELAAKAQEGEVVDGKSGDTDEKSMDESKGHVGESSGVPAQGTDTTPSSGSSIAAATALGLHHIKTHADLLKIPDFKSKYVMPAKAVYKVDRMAKEAEEKAKEMEEKRKEEAGKTSVESTPAAMDAETKEQLGHDSVPVLEKGDVMDMNGTTPAAQEDSASQPPPEQIVESEASMPSPLEQLPLSIYDSIPTSIYEPLFPILLVTSKGDSIVSTSDVEEHHHLAGEVDHIELEDAVDGGHMIMVGDNAQWEEGIMGITEWLDTNGV